MASQSPASAEEAARLQRLSDRLRVDIIEMLHKAGSGHPGGSLSCIDLLTALYFSRLRHDPKAPLWAERDRLVLSKGHAVPAQYACMAEAGYFARELLPTLRQQGSTLQGHPVNTIMPGLEAPTGSLGQGLSVAQGMALASKLDGKPFHVWCIIGDGEAQEGQIWEAAMSAPKFELDTLTVILDYNGGQIDGHVQDVMDIEPVADKWRAFNWNVLSIDGHDMQAILGAMDAAKAHKGQPTFIIANTVKGKGVSFMEREIKWHGSTPDDAQTQKALTELRALVKEEA
jgi:transketolase